MSTPFLKARQTKFGAYAATYILIFIAILVAANYLANRYNKTKDLTGSKLFSLSDQSLKIARNLTSPVKIYYFDRTDAWTNSRFGPSPKDLLTRYSNASPKITAEFVDPVRNPQRAQDMKVSTLGAVIVEAMGRHEEAKGLGEEQITNAIIRALKPDRRTACFMTGHGEPDLENSQQTGFSGVKDALEGNNFNSKPLSLLEKSPTVPADCTVLVEAGPKNDLIEPEIEAIRKFVQGGGRAIFMFDPVTKTVNETALTKLMDEWSININDDLVVDLSGIGQLFGTDEFSPLVTTYGSHIITRDMKNVACLFPLARSVSTGTAKGDVTVEKLFGTSPKSYAVKDFKSGKVSVDPKRDTAGPNLAVAATYNPAPPLTSDAPKVSPGRFIVVGSSRFVANSTLGFPGGNRDLFLNMMSWLSNDEDLIAIRPKEVEDRRLTLTQAQMGRILLSNVFGLPLLIIGAGIWVWWKRK